MGNNFWEHVGCNLNNNLITRVIMISVMRVCDDFGYDIGNAVGISVW